jgi:thioredoxin 1
MLELNDANFDESVAGETPVLVKFGAAWCGPCKMLAPILEDLEAVYIDKAKLFSVDIDSTTIAAKFNIRGVPTVLVFKHGEVVNTIVGLNNKARYQLALDSAIGEEQKAE